MANIFWIHHESDCGGIMPQEDYNEDCVANLVEISTMRNYVHWWRQGYDMDWTPPEWIQDIFPADKIQ